MRFSYAGGSNRSLSSPIYLGLQKCLSAVALVVLDFSPPFNFSVAIYVMTNQGRKPESVVLTVRGRENLGVRSPSQSTHEMHGHIY